MEIVNAALIVLLFSLMTLFGAFGGYCFKKLSSYKIGINKGFLTFFILGGGLYFTGAVLNIVLLRFLPLHPIVSSIIIYICVDDTNFLLPLIRKDFLEETLRDSAYYIWSDFSNEVNFMAGLHTKANIYCRTGILRII